MYAIVPAAGSGSRMGALTEQRAKVLLPLGESPSLLSLTLQSLTASEVLRGVVVVCREEDQAEIDQLLSEHCHGLEQYCVRGGATRQESVWAGLQAVKDKAEYALVHDAARPFCSVEKIREVAKVARQTGAALLAVPAKSSLKRVGNDLEVTETIPRSDIWEAQTPQVFAYETLVEAHRRAEQEMHTGTDDCELVERLGKAVTVVEGADSNIKITTASDLLVAEHILKHGK